MLYTLIVYICATAAPCEPTPQISRVLAHDLTMEACASSGMDEAIRLANGRYFTVVCKLEKQGLPRDSPGQPA